MKRRARLATATAAFIIVLSAFGCARRESSPEQANAAPSVMTVDVVAPQSETWPKTVLADGPLIAWQEIIVSPEIGGLRIAEVLVDVGAAVKQGQLLARLADDSLQADRRKQESIVAQSTAALEQAISNLERAKMVEDSGALSAQRIDEYRISEVTARAALASAQAELDGIDLEIRQARITAPDDGVVSSRSAVLGNVVSVGTELYRMIRRNRIEWRPELDARQLAAVRVGQVAHVTLPSGEQVQGTVRLVGPTLSTDTGRGLLYVSMQHHKDVKAGVFVQGLIELPPTSALTVPQSSVVMRDGRSYVYVVDSSSRVSSRTVTTGRRREDRIEIVSGIQPTDRIVSAGGAFLSEGVHVTTRADAPGATESAAPESSS